MQWPAILPFVQAIASTIIIHTPIDARGHGHVNRTPTIYKVVNREECLLAMLLRSAQQDWGLGPPQDHRAQEWLRYAKGHAISIMGNALPIGRAIPTSSRMHRKGLFLALAQATRRLELA